MVRAASRVGLRERVGAVVALRRCALGRRSACRSGCQRDSADGTDGQYGDDEDSPHPVIPHCVTRSHVLFSVIGIHGGRMTNPCHAFLNRDLVRTRSRLRRRLSERDSKLTRCACSSPVARFATPAV
jgi:hypothetical protein